MLIGGIAMYVWLTICSSLVAVVCYYAFRRVPDPLETKAFHYRHSYLEKETDEKDIDFAQGSRSKIVRATICHLRTEIGLISDTKANRLIVSDRARAYMKTKGMRPTHISKFFQHAVDFYFLMTEDDRELMLVRKTREVARWRRGNVDQ